MKIKLHLITFFLLTVAISYGQNGYYYYKGKKTNLEIDKTKIDISTNINFDINSLKKLGLKKISFQNNNSKRKQQYKKATIEFENNLNKDVFLSKIEAISATIGIRNYSLYYKRKNTKSIGTSNIFYVKLKSENDIEILKQVAKENNTTIVHQNKFMPLWYKLQVNQNSNQTTIELSNKFYETNLFDDIDPNFMFNFSKNCTNDTNFNQLWGLKNNTNPNIDINICDAWAITEGNGVNVAVLDQGIDKTHNDLNNNISTLSYDTQNGSNPSVFTNGNIHGTHVAGIIGAEKDNNLQVVGVAPKSKIISVSNTLSISSTISEELANGINWAVQNGADIINNSWGDQGGQFYGNLHSSLLENAITNALNNGRNGLGTILVFASGNHSPAIDYPASFHGDELVVGSIDSNGIKSSFSGYGNDLDVVAPGGGILSTIPNQGIDYLSGTSMAAPFVSGIAALILSINPNLTVQEVNNIIESTSQKVGNYSYTNTSNRFNGTWNNKMGYGLIDANAAVQLAQQLSSTKLTGNYSICSSPQKTYTLTNGGNNVSWQVSSNLNIISSSNSQITIQAVNTNSSGEGYIKAILPNQTLKKTLWVEVPVFSLNRDLPYGGVNGDNQDQFCKSHYYSFDNHITINAEGGLISQYVVEKISNNFGFQQTYASLVIQPHTLGIMSLRARVQNECGWSNWQYYQYEIVDCGGNSGPGGFRVAKNPIESNTITLEETKDSKINSDKNKGEYLQIELYNSKGLLVKSKKVKRDLFNKKYQLEIAEVKNGRYFIKIISGDFNETYQIIINKK